VGAAAPGAATPAQVQALEAALAQCADAKVVTAVRKRLAAGLTEQAADEALNYVRRAAQEDARPPDPVTATRDQVADAVPARGAAAAQAPASQRAHVPADDNTLPF
jgi:hypothetical protein